MRRRHPLPHSAPPAPSDTTSAAPSRRPGTPPPGNPPSSAPCRTATGARSRGAGMPGPRASAPVSVLSMRLEPSASRPRTTSAGFLAGNPRARSRAAIRRPSHAEWPSAHAGRQTRRHDEERRGSVQYVPDGRQLQAVRHVLQVLDQLALHDTLGFLRPATGSQPRRNPAGSCELRRPGRSSSPSRQAPSKPADQRFCPAPVYSRVPQLAWSRNLVRSHQTDIDIAAWSSGPMLREYTITCIASIADSPTNRA